MIKIKDTRPHRGLILLPFFIFTHSVSFSQKDTQGNKHANRYRLDLPKEWNDKPKLLAAIKEILPKSVEELKNLEIGNDGKPAFIVQLVIESLRVGKPWYPPAGYDSRTINYPCSFFAGFRVYDSAGKPITQLVLVKPDEKYDYSKKTALSNDYSEGSYTYEDRTIYDSSGKAAIGTVRVAVPDPKMVSPIEYEFNANVSTDFLLDICASKIYKIRKMLTKLNVARE